LENLTHGILVLAGLGTVGNELQALFTLVTERLTNLGGGVLGEAIDTGSNGTLVG